MVSVEKWKEHFKRLAQRSHPHESMFIVSQSGRGLGRNTNNKKLYQIRTPAVSSTIEMVTPMGSSLTNGGSMVKSSGIKRKKKSKPASRNTGRPTDKTSAKNKPKKKKTPKAKKETCHQNQGKETQS